MLFAEELDSLGFLSGICGNFFENRPDDSDHEVHKIEHHSILIILQLFLAGQFKVFDK